MLVKEIDVAELNERLASAHPPLLLDIRTDAEWTQGIIPGAEFLPMHLLPLRFQELDDGREIVVYCRSGARSYNACGFLMQHGIDRCVNLRGGILAWAGNGFAIERPTPDQGLLETG